MFIIEEIILHEGLRRKAHLDSDIIYLNRRSIYYTVYSGMLSQGAEIFRSVEDITLELNVFDGLKNVSAILVVRST